VNLRHQLAIAHVLDRADTTIPEQLKAQRRLPSGLIVLSILAVDR
jgi:hypothetical protein